jgi:hypothetical protein
MTETRTKTITRSAELECSRLKIKNVFGNVYHFIRDKWSYNDFLLDFLGTW